MLTRVLVRVLLCCVLVLMNPFPVTLEEDLQSGSGAAPQPDRVAFDDVSVFRLLQEVWQRPADRGRIRSGVSCRPWEMTIELGSEEIMHVW